MAYLLRGCFVFCSLLAAGISGCSGDGDSNTGSGGSGGSGGSVTTGGTSGAGVGGSTASGGAGAAGGAGGTAASGGSAGSGGSGVDVPVVESFDCASLPSAVKGGDPESERFFIDLHDDLTCATGSPSATPDYTGAFLMFEYYGVDGAMNGIVSAKGVYQTTQTFLEFASISAPGVEILTDINGSPYGASGVPWGEDVTLTLTDFPAKARTIEVVFQIAPPYLIIRSVTEK